MPSHNHFSIFFFWLCFTTSLFSQGYIDYHKGMRRAEAFILEKNYSKSIQCYDSTFSEYGYPFAEDIWMALEASILGQDVEAIIKYIELAAKNGIPLKKLKRFKPFHELRKHPKIQPALKSYPELYSSFLDQIDYAQRNLLESIAKQDQKIRKSGNPSQKQKMEIAKVDERNFSILRQLIQDNGYPTSKEIGFSRKGERLWPFWILIHTCTNPELYTDEFRSLLRKEVEAGRLHPRHFAAFEDRLLGPKPLYGTPWNHNNGPVDLQQFGGLIDKNRVSIGLEPLKMSGRKLSSQKNLFPYVLL